jgi:poly(hydroxyalkanoate) granule-associated protein
MATKATKKTSKSGAGTRRAPAAAGNAWPVGLDTVAKVQQGGVKMFESLLRQGQALERKTREAAVSTAAAARDAAAEGAREVQQLAGGTWDKLEQVFEDRVARALAKLGIYTQQDVQELSRRVDALSAAVNRLLATKQGAAKPGTRASGTHARRTTAVKTRRTQSAKRAAK